MDVPARTLVVTWVVEEGDTPVRFRAPVSTAVPAFALVDHLVRWLRLPAGRWRVHLGGRELDRFEVLGSLALDSAPELVVRR